MIGHFIRFISICRTVTGRFQDTRRNNWRRQDNESTTFWKRSSRRPEANPY